MGRLNIAIEKDIEITNKIIILGDTNEDQLNCNNHHLKNVMALNNLSNLINVPTRKSFNSETLLDPAVVHESVKVLDSGILDVEPSISDHSTTYVFVS